MCIAENKLGKGEILEAGKEGLMRLKREAVAGVPYKGCGILGCVGWVKIDEIVSAHAEQGGLNILAGEDDPLDKVGHGSEFIGIIDGGILIMSEGDIEAVWAFPIEASEAGLIEKEEHGGCVDPLRVCSIEAGTSPIVEGFLGSGALFGGLWASIQHLGLMLAGTHVCVDELL